jgi:hypothetical protein
MLSDHLALKSHSPLLRRLNAMAPLSADEIALVASASRRLTFPAGASAAATNGPSLARR